jgi:hypothetical protein
MSNLIAALKHEITRLARKEIRAQTGHVKQAAAHHRREIAKLKRELKSHEKQLAFLEGQEKERLGRPAVALLIPGHFSEQNPVVLVLVDEGFYYRVFAG